MPKRIPLEGSLINKLTVINYNSEKQKYLCKCECGKELTISYGCLKRGQESCGCNRIITMKSKREILEGKKFGRYLVLSYIGRKDNGIQYYLCKCECGVEKEVTKTSLTSGSSKSCGCYNKEVAATKCKAGRIKLEGKKFSRLTVIKYNEDSIHSYECLCDCGKIANIRGAFLRSGHTTSCGCFHKEVIESHFSKNRNKVKEQFTSTASVLTSAKKVWERYKKDTDLTFEEFFKLSQEKCNYCKTEPRLTYNFAKYWIKRKPNTVFPKDLSFYDFKYNGLDRVDNSLDHRKSNIVPCCWQCNQFKCARSVDEFFAHIKRLIDHRFFEKEIKLVGGGDNIKMINEARVKEYWFKRYSDGDISLEKFLELSGGNCFYCGTEPNGIRPCRKNIDLKYNGLDRLDNKRGHYLDNVVVCCGECNLKKGDQSFDEFKNWILKFSTL